MHLERDGDGYVVHYAIADVAAFVEPGGAVDAEAHRRGESLYGADTKIPLHPTVLSEGAASLLPDAGASGAAVDDRARRARRRSPTATSSGRGCGRAPSCDYDGVQARRSTPAPPTRCSALLEEVGDAAHRSRRPSAAASRCRCPSRRSSIERRPLAAGVPRAAAGRGVERADLAAHRHRRGLDHARRQGRHPAHAAARRPDAVERLRRTARALRHRLARRAGLPRLHPVARPVEARHAAMVVACTSLLRGAGYAAFDGELPEQPRARRARLAVRPRHRAAAPPGRPLRAGDLRRALRG